MANEPRQRPSLWLELITPAVWLASMLAGLFSLLGDGAEYRAEHRDVAYEHSDIRVNTVLLSIGGLLLSTAIICGFLCLVYLMYSRHYSATTAKDNGSARQTLPPEPRLQESPSQDLANVRRNTDAELNKYSWIDKQNGIVAIPIDRAMELMAQRGVPPQKASANIYFEPHAGSPETGFDRRLRQEER